MSESRVGGAQKFGFVCCRQRVRRETARQGGKARGRVPSRAHTQTLPQLTTPPPFQLSSDSGRSNQPVFRPLNVFRSILNNHPSLLPSFGGKGHYGMKVHKAVIASGARYVGPTIHFVDEHYDTERIHSQRVVPVLAKDTARGAGSKGSSGGELGARFFGTS